MLAREVTTRVHGAAAAAVAEEVSALLFGGADAGSLSLPALEALREEVPYLEHGDGSLDVSASEPAGSDVLDLLVQTKLAASRGAARRLLEQGGVYVNGQRLSASERTVGRDRLLHGRFLLLRKGAREYALVRVD